MFLLTIPMVGLANENDEKTSIVLKNSHYGYIADDEFYYIENGKIFREKDSEKTSILEEYKVLKLQKIDSTVFAVVETNAGEEKSVALAQASSDEKQLFGLSLYASNSNETTIYNFLKNTMGVNTAAACGILANIQKESSFNPTAECIDVNGLTSYGICQWNGVRFTALKNYCSNKGYSYTSLNGQLNYLKYELEGNEKSAYSKIRNVDNTQSGAYNAGYNWARYFERCAQSYYTQRAVLARDTYWGRYSSSSDAPSVSSGTYDAAAAVSYAKNHWNDGKGLCAEFVSDCLSAGGISVSIATTRSLRNYLVNNGYANDYLITKTQGVRVKMSDYSDKIAPGDVIINYCVQCDVYPHVMLVSGVNSSGQVTYYAHNSAANNKAYWNGSEGYKSHGNGSHTFYMYVLHMKNATSNGVTHPQPVHSHSYSVKTDSAHPHNKYNICSCGESISIGTSLSSTCNKCYPLGSISLKRSFEKTKGNVTFYRNNVQNANNYTLKLYKDSSLYNTYTFSDTEYSLKGLSSGEYYARLYAENTNTGEEKNVKCTSFRIVDTYTVSYNANGGTSAPSSQTKIEDEDLTLSSSSPKREHYVFKGWATSKKAVTAKYQPGDAYSKNSKITFYAVWEPETYTVKYDANGGKGELENITVTYGDTIKMPNTLVQDYCYLKGWATSKTASAAEYKLGLDYKIDANLTLYAVWGSSTWGGEVSSSLNGHGTKEKPYEIATAADLAYLAKKVNNQTSVPSYEYYKLTDNINLLYSEWVPIGLSGNENQYFYGNFDGNGFTISDLYITQPNEGCIGLFGKVKSSQIKNLTVTGAIESIASGGEVNIGAIVGYSSATKLDKLSSLFFNIGSITAGTTDYTRMGTIAGYVANGSIENCISKDCHIDLKSGKFEAGMIAGYCNSDIKNCSVTASEGGLFSSAATVNAFRMGGLCGRLTKTAEKCTVEAPYLSNNIKITAASSVGGLVGALEGEAKVCTVKFSNSESNSMSMSGAGSADIGGIAGEASEEAKITDCKFDGKAITAETTSGEISVGGLIGKAKAKKIPTVNLRGGQSLNYESLPKRSGYRATWYNDAAFTSLYDFSQTATENLTLYAKWEEDDDTPDIWDGTSKEPAYDAASKTYIITNGEELAWVSDVTNGVIKSGTNFPTDITFAGYYIELANDIYLNDITNYENWETTAPNNTWKPIGTYDGYPHKLFSGTFDGKCNSVYGLYIYSSVDYCGLFGYVENATIKQICVKESFVTGSGEYYGGVVGYAKDSSVLSSVNYAEIHGDYCIGGIVGGGTNIISNCVNYGGITGSHLLGGITGKNSKYYITLCHNYGNVTGTNRVGGISGDTDGEIAECGNHADIIGSERVGGIAGICNGLIENSYNESTIIVSAREGGGIVGYASCDIKYCYNAGAVGEHGAYNIGGIAGELENSHVVNYCYNSGNLAGTNFVGGLIGNCFPGMDAPEMGSITVKYSYNIGSLDCIVGNCGGIVGYWGYNGSYKLYLKYCHALQSTWYSTSDNGRQYVSTTSCSTQSPKTKVKNISNLTGFSTSDWTTNSSINDGYPYLRVLEENYKTYSVTTIVDAESSAINRSFVNVDGILSGKANQNSRVGGIIGYGYGESNSASAIKNLISMADDISSQTTGSSYKAYSGNVVGYNNGNKFSFENTYYNTEMNVSSSTNSIDTTGIARSEKTMNVAFYTNLLGLTPYVSLDNLKNDSSAVWVLKNGQLPELYYNCLNDITISENIENGSVSVDKAQAVDGEIVTVSALPNENYVLNKVYVNGEELAGNTFEVSGDSEVYVTFAEKVPQYEVSISANENASATLTNADASGGIALLSAQESGENLLTANDGEEIIVDATTASDYTVDAIYVNGEEIAGESFILTADSVVTMDVVSINTKLQATTKKATDIKAYTATLSGSVSDTEEATRYILYWQSDNPSEVYTTEVQNGGGLYSIPVTGLEANTEYSFQMTENGEILTFVTLADSEGEEDTAEETITSTKYEKKTTEYNFTIEAKRKLSNEFLSVALYDGENTLLDRQIVQCDGKAVYTESLPIKSNAKYIKVFVWDALDSIKPLAKEEKILITE